MRRRQSPLDKPNKLQLEERRQYGRPRPQSTPQSSSQSMERVFPTLLTPPWSQAHPISHLRILANPEDAPAGPPWQKAKTVQVLRPPAPVEGDCRSALKQGAIPRL